MKTTLNTAAWQQSGVEPLHRMTVEDDLLGGDPWMRTYQGIAPRIGTGMLLAMVGPRGTGKTQMAAKLIHDCCYAASNPLGQDKQTPCAKYARLMTLLMELKESYRGNGPSESDIIKRYAAPSLLVLDELHERSESDWEQRVITMLIDLRYSRKRDTILISNQKPDFFLKSVGPSIASRMEEKGEIVRCEWASYRKGNAT